MDSHREILKGGKPHFSFFLSSHRSLSRQVYSFERTYGRGPSYHQRQQETNMLPLFLRISLPEIVDISRP